MFSCTVRTEYFLTERCNNKKKLPSVNLMESNNSSYKTDKYSMKSEINRIESIIHVRTPVLK